MGLIHTPKTDYVSTDKPTNINLNKIEENIQSLEDTKADLSGNVIFQNVDLSKLNFNNIEFAYWEYVVTTAVGTWYYESSPGFYLILWPAPDPALGADNFSARLFIDVEVPGSPGTFASAKQAAAGGPPYTGQLLYCSGPQGRFRMMFSSGVLLGLRVYHLKIPA